MLRCVPNHRDHDDAYEHRVPLQVRRHRIDGAGEEFGKPGHDNRAEQQDEDRLPDRPMMTKGADSPGVLVGQCRRR